MDSYGFITLGSIADFRGFSALDWIRKCQVQEIGKPPKPFKSMNHETQFVHDLGMGNK